MAHFFTRDVSGVATAHHVSHLQSDQSRTGPSFRRGGHDDAQLCCLQSAPGLDRTDPKGGCFRGVWVKLALFAYGDGLDS